MPTSDTFRSVALAATVIFVAPTGAAPPPPPPAFIDDIAKCIVPTPTAAGFGAYAAAMADDLVVTIDGRRVSSDKKSWLATERKRLGKVDRYVFSFAESYDAILVVDRFDDRSDISGADTSMVFDPRYKARAVKYAIGPDRLVHAIDVTQTDGMFQAPK